MIRGMDESMSTAERVRQLLAEIFDIPVDEIGPGTKFSSLTSKQERSIGRTANSGFVDDLTVGSLNLVEFVMVIEEEFDIEVPEAEDDGRFPQDMTVQEIADLIDRLRKRED